MIFIVERATTSAEKMVIVLRVLAFVLMALETVMKTMKQTDVKPITPLSNTVAIAATTAVPTLFVPVDRVNVIPVC